MTDEMQQGPATLAPKRERFVGEYLVDLNAAAAARRAGYSQRTARAIGHELLTKPDIQAALTQAQQGRAERMELTADGVVADLQRLGLAAEGKGFYSAAIRAVELQGKHLGMFVERQQVENLTRVRIVTVEGPDGEASDAPDAPDAPDSQEVEASACVRTVEVEGPDGEASDAPDAPERRQARKGLVCASGNRSVHSSHRTRSRPPFYGLGARGR